MKSWIKPWGKIIKKILAICKCCGCGPVSIEFSGNLSLTLLRWVRPQECTSCFDGFAVGRSQAELHQALVTRCSSRSLISTQSPATHVSLGRWWGGIISLSPGSPHLGCWCLPVWKRMLPGKSFSQDFWTWAVTFFLLKSETGDVTCHGPCITYMQSI